MSKGRKRGRPPKNPNSNNNKTTEKIPLAHSITKRKRGRPRINKNNSKLPSQSQHDTLIPQKLNIIPETKSLNEDMENSNIKEEVYTDDLKNTNLEVKTKASRSRNESSLSVLTVKFLQMLRDADNGMIDLNNAVNILKVQKRRIYDITNVLEGIGYIQKFAKNTIKLIDQKENEGLNRKMEIQEKTLKVLQEEEIRYDNEIIEYQQELMRLGKVFEINNMKLMFY
jgi:hypothetical protein